MSLIAKEIKLNWGKVQALVSSRFGENLDEQTILFLIGLQELNITSKKLTKEQKLDVLHIGICSVLEPFGYYKRIGEDADNWPHFKNIKKLPRNQELSQEQLLKTAIIKYFKIDC